MTIHSVTIGNMYYEITKKKLLINKNIGLIKPIINFILMEGPLII